MIEETGRGSAQDKTLVRQLRAQLAEKARDIKDLTKLAGPDHEPLLDGFSRACRDIFGDDRVGSLPMKMRCARPPKCYVDPYQHS